MPRLPSCCQQHSPCGGPSPGHLSLSHSHSSCLQASSSQQTSGSQHSHSTTHHFLHHVHHPAPQPPGTVPFQEPSCPVERPTALPAPGSSNNSGSSNAAHYHDQVWLRFMLFVPTIWRFALVKLFVWNHEKKDSELIIWGSKNTMKWTLFCFGVYSESGETGATKVLQKFDFIVRYDIEGKQISKFVPHFPFAFLLSSHSKLCQWTWATAAFGVVETAGLVSMAAHQPLTRAAQAPPHGLLLMFHMPPLGPASQLWWTHSAPPWWLSHKHSPSPADITCIHLVSKPPFSSTGNQTFSDGLIPHSFCKSNFSASGSSMMMIRPFAVTRVKIVRVSFLKPDANSN